MVKILKSRTRLKNAIDLSYYETSILYYLRQYRDKVNLGTISNCLYCCNLSNYSIFRNSVTFLYENKLINLDDKGNIKLINITIKGLNLLDKYLCGLKNE